jgi:predicted nucleic acid-binding protein
VILIDAGPLVALFDPQDSLHRQCAETLEGIHEPINSTIPVLTEAFHLLQPQSRGADRLREFISGGGLSIWFFTKPALVRAFELMELYADHPMDLADASLVVAAESLRTRKVFTIDRNDFEAYRWRSGHRHYSFEILS